MMEQEQDPKQDLRQEQYACFPLEKIRGVMPKLKEADIILVHQKHSFIRYLLRIITNSYWDHVALVLFPKDLAKGQYYNQIIEAAYPHGIEIHKLEKYLKNPGIYDIAIKRFPDLDEATRKRTVAFMLMNVDAPYYKGSIFSFIFAALSKKFSIKFLAQQRFCSSGFVQKAFYEAANWDEREKLIFRKDYLSPMELQDLTTPADVANSTNTVWVYNQPIAFGKKCKPEKL